MMFAEMLNFFLGVDGAISQMRQLNLELFKHVFIKWNFLWSMDVLVMDGTAKLVCLGVQVLFIADMAKVVTAENHYRFVLVCIIVVFAYFTEGLTFHCVST
jgi:hypothetical protein